ncbi:hypothetical protein AWZ03_006050 [Drosophila navojoa]|uniref:Aprataxin C2HE/C2H2/C2HC zinc finger domain-containing protein n=1 Tax=Drosophila navojoa TaxID=7232 RepID=A0A484BIM2_DRONA|nr:aprataxin-like protein [Drosophila navojoa]TDG47611.1 hypothetical protein AWZ03_006050 [Drosophila navojoa]
MAESEIDVEHKRGELTRKLNAGEDVVIQSDRAAVLRNVTCPKAQYHFVVLPKEEIANVLALKREHLPLLEHMMDLANDVIKQQQLPPSDFRIGFKINAFMNRLNMHVISTDFYSSSMRRIQQWNTFNSDLFITFQAIYALLLVKGSVEPMPAEKVEELLQATPVHCNQCSFYTENFFQFKRHLYIHWMERQSERLRKISQQMGQMQINGNRGTMRQPPVNPFYRQVIPMHNNQFVTRFQRPQSHNPTHHNRNPNNIRPSYRHPAPPKPLSSDLQQTQADAASNAAPGKGAEQRVDAKLPVKKKWYSNKKKNSQSSSNPKGGANTNNPKGGANTNLI